MVTEDTCSSECTGNGQCRLSPLARAEAKLLNSKSRKRKSLCDAFRQAKFNRPTHKKLVTLPYSCKSLDNIDASIDLKRNQHREPQNAVFSISGISNSTFDYLVWYEQIKCSRVCKSWNRILHTSGKLLAASSKDEEWEKIWNGMEKDTPLTNIANVQKEISFPMRAILVEWMLQVSEEFENHLDTTFLAASIVDQILEKVPISKTELQLVGIASVLVASKLLETQFPDLHELLYLCDQLYSHSQLLDMEMRVLALLNFSPQRLTTYSYLKFLQGQFNIDPPELKCIGVYLAEISLLSARFLKIHQICVASTITALLLFKFNAPKIHFIMLSELCKTRFQDMCNAAEDLREVTRFARRGTLDYIKNKYDVEELGHIPDLPIEDEIDELCDYLHVLSRQQE